MIGGRGTVLTIGPSDMFYYIKGRIRDDLYITLKKKKAAAAAAAAPECWKLRPPPPGRENPMALRGPSKRAAGYIPTTRCVHQVKAPPNQPRYDAARYSPKKKEKKKKS